MGTIETTQTPGLGVRVRAARRERGFSQAQLAGEELTKGFISQVESGLVRPSVRSLSGCETRRLRIGGRWNWGRGTCRRAPRRWS